MTNSNSPWTPAATTTAHRLASAYGHGWADFAVRHEDGSLDLEGTEAAQVEGEHESLTGLRPALHHTTGSGRLSWEIRDNGAVRLTVTRPLTAVSPLAHGLDGHVVVAVATLMPAHEHPLWTGSEFVRVPSSGWSRPAWGRSDGPHEDSRGQWVGDFYVEIDVVAELCEDRHSEALGYALFAVLGGRDKIQPTRTGSVLRGEDWRDAHYVEIDGHEFWMRDLPEEEEITVEPPVLTVSVHSARGEVQA